MATATRVTLEEFLAIPEFDEQRLELLDGEVYEKPMPNTGHTDIAAYLTIHTARFGRPRGQLRAMIPATSASDASSPLPDFVLFVGDHPRGKEWMTSGSTIAVEIMSPGQRRLEMRRKIDMYIAFGVKSAWIIDPEQRDVEVYEHGQRRILTDADVLTTEFVPGLAINLREMFDYAES